MIQNTYSMFSQDKEKLETLIGGAKELIQSIRNENITQNDQNMNASQFSTMVLINLQLMDN